MATLDEQLARAKTFGELRALLQPFPRLLAVTRFDVVGAFDTDPKFRLKFIEGGPHAPVGDFLASADRAVWTRNEFREIHQGLVRWARLAVGASTGVAPVGLLTTEGLLARIASFGIPDLEDWTLAMLDGEGWAGAHLGFIARNGNKAELDRRLTKFEARVASLRQLEFPPQQLSDFEPLARVQRVALAERRKLDAWPPDLAKVQFELLMSGPDLVISVRVQGGDGPRAVVARRFTSWATSPTLDCACRRPMCLHRVVVFEGLAYRWSTEEASGAFLRKALEPQWERLLGFLGAPTEPEPKKGLLSFRLWESGVELRFHEHGKRGPSAKGRVVKAMEVLERLEGVDLRIAERFALARPDPQRGVTPQYGDGLLLLEGHPRVYWEDERTTTPVVRVDAQVKVDEGEAGFALGFRVGDLEFDRALPVFRRTGGGVTFARAPHAIVIAPVTEQFLRFAAMSGELGPELPKEAAPRLVELLPKLEAAAVVELPDELRGDERTPTERPVVQVTKSGEGLSLAIRVEPLEKGPVFVPGQGVAVSATFDGRRRAFVRRRFEHELAEANALAGELGLDPATADTPYTWPLDPRAERHIETLRRLQSRDVPVEWQAPRVKFTSEAKLERLKLRIERKKDWFGLEGEATVDDRRVSLAALLEAARARRRFVKLGDGDFAQLSEAMVDALGPLAHLGAPGTVTQLTLGAAPLIDALAPQLEGLDAAKEWTALMTRLADAKQARFAVPPTLQATLRDYQVEGFEWLSRLAQWGVGACLADDMGLGKTLQALTLLLSRAAQGPALVVAPSSVLHTWRAEAAKFAPSLKLSLFHEGDRALGKLGGGEVVVVSWSLFAREAAAFSKVRFATAVLDEAQAIKNAGTQRAKAAHGLEADFVVALSGTPVENHVGELWSLFKAVMPALLGSEESYRARFGAGDKGALSALATLVRPFILRRTKGAVAKELPARTDLELVIPLSAEERALYDDVRLSAVTDLGEVTGEKKRFDVLAALTRLRLTACHPRLVDAGWAGPTSKLTRLLELVKDLSSAGHRVLVFSQFTQHLALVVDALRTEGVVFSYLDGQVPLAERQRRVEAFQQGTGGDVFLVSLKAGGTGLTLTAADYVIHLDPWWNPAVEDQASDRAHRIGQQRPVTVYRLIAEGTIEQQILSLHRDKRELVDALLEGADTAGKLSTAQLAQLIAG